MSKRARCARRMATVLTARAGTHVSVHYDRDLRRYRVIWTNGPDATQMYGMAVSVADSVPELDVFDLLWRRDVTT